MDWGSLPLGGSTTEARFSRTAGREARSLKPVVDGPRFAIAFRATASHCVVSPIQGSTPEGSGGLHLNPVGPKSQCHGSVTVLAMPRGDQSAASRSAKSWLTFISSGNEQTFPPCFNRPALTEIPEQPCSITGLVPPSLRLQSSDLVTVNNSRIRGGRGRIDA